MSRQSEKMKSQKQNELIRILIKESLYNSISQAIIKIFQSPYPFIKCYLFVFTCAVTALCSYLVIQSIMTYFSFEVSTTSRTIFETPTLFPKVTICNTNVFTTEYSFKVLEQISKEYNQTLNIFEPKQIENLTFEEKEIARKIQLAFK